MENNKPNPKPISSNSSTPADSNHSPGCPLYEGLGPIVRKHQEDDSEDVVGDNSNTPVLPCEIQKDIRAARDLSRAMDGVDGHSSTAPTLRHLGLYTPPESPEKDVPPRWNSVVIDSVRGREPRWSTSNIVDGGHGIMHSVVTGMMVSQKLRGLSDGAPTRIKLVCATLKVHNPDAIVAIQMSVYDPEAKKMIKKEFTGDSNGLKVSYTWGSRMPANGIAFSGLKEIASYWITGLPLGESQDTESLFTLAIQWK